MRLRWIGLCLLQIVAVVFMIVGMAGAGAADVTGDIDRDGRIGLKEAIFALQVAAGVKPEFGAQFSADGTYTYNGTTGLLTVNYTSSNFTPAEGPGVGEFVYTVGAVTETSMTCRSTDDGTVTEWSRSPGITGDIAGTWKFYDAEYRNTYILTIGPGDLVRLDGYIVDYREALRVSWKTITVDGLFSDWTDNDLVYEDTDGPECDTVAGRDIVRVYVAQDRQFIYLRMDLNDAPDPASGYKFGGWLHVHVGRDNADTAPYIFLTTPAGCSFADSTAAVSFDASRFECRFDKSLASHWNADYISAWCDQGNATVCRDYIDLPLLQFDFSSGTCDDADADGYYVQQGCPGSFGVDCDDTDASIHPGAEELCGDGIDNNCDGSIDEDCPPPDMDEDGVPDASDNCVNTPNPGQEDGDADGIGDACDPCTAVPEVCGDGVDNDCDGATDEGCPPPDLDGDGIPNTEDNCPYTYNPGQEDANGDGVGDACVEICGDSVDNDHDGMTDEGCIDTDNDGILDGDDNCPYTHNPGQEDADSDGIGDVCDPCTAVPEVCGDGVDNDCDGATDEDCAIADADEDGIPDEDDNCPMVANSGQEDNDGDGRGNACDNCPFTYNPGQEDANNNGIGDACEEVCDGVDNDHDGLTDEGCP